MKNYILVFVCILIASCSSKKDILYFQDDFSKTNYEVFYQQYKIKVDDILKIDISSPAIELANPFSISPMANTTSSTKEVLLYNGFQVDSNGYIDIPSIGNVLASGLTIDELELFIKNHIIEKELLTKPTVDIKHLNSYVTVLGEVNRPGKYDFLKNNMNILDAIGIAGDLTINGKRDNVKIIRVSDNKTSLIELDLTDSSEIFENYQIFSGDIIVVSPNSNRVKNAGIIGNSGTLLSLLSFILSSIIVATNN
tara:strand:+ start:3884 stop:4642 length:759 start_codon:yes stop_codon:yes gene_type:complete